MGTRRFLVVAVRGGRTIRNSYTIGSYLREVQVWCEHPTKRVAWLNTLQK